MAWVDAVPPLHRLIYVYARPPEYRATARLKIAPAAMVSEASDTKSTPSVGTDATSFLSEVQILTSRPVLETAFERLKEKGPTPDFGADPVAEIQRSMRAEPIPGTQIVELTADSHQQGLVAPLVNTVIDAYREQTAAVYRGSAVSSYSDVKDEIGKLDLEIRAKRQAVDAFRAQYDIVSIEHKENDVLAQIAGLNQSYTEARNRLAKAQAHLQALRNSIDAGTLVVRPKDDPVLTDIEQRASVLREQWQELQRRFTPAYLAFDPGAKSLQARLDALESQLKTQRATSARAALAEAQAEVAAAQTANEQLRQDVAENQKHAQEFATHLNQAKSSERRGLTCCRPRAQAWSPTGLITIETRSLPLLARCSSGCLPPGSPISCLVHRHSPRFLRSHCSTRGCRCCRVTTGLPRRQRSRHLKPHAFQRRHRCLDS